MVRKTRKDFENDEDYREYRDKENRIERERLADPVKKARSNRKERERRAKIRPQINKTETLRKSKIRPQINAGERKRGRDDKHAALQAYSEGDSQCLHCGETQIEFLTLDHISGRASMGHAKYIKGPRLYALLRRENYPPGMQILCWNWNEIKGKADLWRNTPKTKELVRRKELRHNLKKEVLTHYCSGKKPYCVCCGYDELAGLTIDHMYGRKKIPKDEAEVDGHKLRALLKKKNYPKDYQVLCFNCNSAKSDKDTCPGLPPKHKLSEKI
jgi:hypothetical protein